MATILPLLAAHGTKTRSSYFVRCRCGHVVGGALDSRPTLHEHEADMLADAILALGFEVTP